MPAVYKAIVRRVLIMHENTSFLLLFQYSKLNFFLVMAARA